MSINIQETLREYKQLSNPILIAVDSANNTGKTKLIKQLEYNILKYGLTCKIVKQPFYDESRKKLLKDKSLTNRQQCELFLKDRIKLHTLEIFRSDVDVIIMDRSFVSSMVYQAILYQDIELIRHIKENTKEIYKLLDYNITIGVNLITEDEIIQERQLDKLESLKSSINRDTIEYDCRDTIDLAKIKSEKEGYSVAWEIATNMEIVDILLEYENDTPSDREFIVENLMDEIVEIVKDKTDKIGEVDKRGK